MRKRTNSTVREAMARLEAHQRELDDAKGRKTQGAESKPKRGRPCKRAYGEPKDQAQSNFTDPESAIMKTSNDGFQQCYNAQLAVEGENQIIVATQVTADATDQGRLMPVVEVKANCGARCHRRCWPMQATRMRRIWSGWRIKALKVTLRWAGRSDWRQLKRTIQRFGNGCARNSEAQTVALCTVSANGCRRHRMDGSSTYWDFANSACED